MIKDWSLGDCMNEIIEFGLLLDYYGQFLTQNQLKAMELYLYDDWSTTEIAEHLGISRQGAHDYIKKSKIMLLDYEDKLHLVKRTLDSRIVLKDVIRDCNLLKDKLTDDPSAILCEFIIKRLEDMLKD